MQDGIADAADAVGTETFSDDPGDTLVVDLGGFEGPLDLLLALARTHRLDLTELSMGELAEQYLLFVAQAADLDLDRAADYLVMAAWLTFLKSKLLLPKPAEEVDTPLSAPELAARLAFRLKRLEAMRNAATALFRRPLLGRDVFARPGGAGELPFAEFNDRDEQPPEIVWRADVNDLVRAYAGIVNRRARPAHVAPPTRVVWTIGEARQRLERLMGSALGWFDLAGAVQQFIAGLTPEQRLRLGQGPRSAEGAQSPASALSADPKEGTLSADAGGASDPQSGRAVSSLLASSFGATLELAKEGRVEIAQSATFAPLMVRPIGGAPDLKASEQRDGQTADGALREPGPVDGTAREADDAGP